MGEAPEWEIEDIKENQSWAGKNYRATVIKRDALGKLTVDVYVLADTELQAYKIVWEQIKEGNIHT